MKTSIYKSSFAALLFLFMLPMASFGIQACMVDGFGYTWSLTLTNAGPTYSISGTVNVVGAACPTWSVSGSYTKSTHAITLTATNPCGDNCTSSSDNFTYTGTKTGANFSGSWTNDCASSGTWTGSGSLGACRIIQPIEGSVLYGPGSPNGGQENYSVPVGSGWNLDELGVNSPNPFTNETNITYSISDASNVVLEIYNALGQQVITLVNGKQDAGDYSIIWNAKDSKGNTCAPGNYFTRLTVNNTTSTNTMTLSH